jgi:hypothetical protein
MVSPSENLAKEIEQENEEYERKGDGNYCVLKFDFTHYKLNH